MTQINYYQSIMNSFGLQDYIVVTQIGTIHENQSFITQSKQIHVPIKNVCQIEDCTNYRLIHYFSAMSPLIMVSDTMESIMNQIEALKNRNNPKENKTMTTEENNRIPFPFYYLGIAEAVSKRSTCLSKRYGAVVVKDNVVRSTGFNGAPRGRKNCTDIGYCPRLENNVKRGTDYSTSCRSVHGEMNAIINASPDELKDATLYLYGYNRATHEMVKDANCCPICKRLIINAGIKDVVVADPDVGIGHPEVPYRYRTIQVSDWVENDESLQANEGY